MQQNENVGNKDGGCRFMSGNQKQKAETLISGPKKILYSKFKKAKIDKISLVNSAGKETKASITFWATVVYKRVVNRAYGFETTEKWYEIEPEAVLLK